MKPLLALLLAASLPRPVEQEKPSPGSTSRPADPGAEERAFKRRVDEAVDRGVAWLRSRQEADGSFGLFTYHENRRYRAGYTAIALLALLASNVNKYEPAIQRGFAFLDENPAAQVYEIGLSLMALDMKAAPLYERFDLEKMDLAARQAYRFPRDLSERDRKVMVGYVSFLEQHRFYGLWKYGAYPVEGDVSNSQFAILGLKAAARCGIKVDPDVWFDTLDYFLKYQVPCGPPAKVSKFKGTGKDGRPEFYSFSAVPRGWGYEHGQMDPAKVTGARACIGIACLLLCREELMKPGSGTAGGKGRTKAAKVEEAIRDGLAWLEQNYSVTENPKDPTWLYYYLYALERVGVLTEARYVGTHDWYREGAEFLLRDQRQDGSWPGTGWSFEFPNTCFALLFLRRSTYPPVYTGNRGD